MDIKNLHFNKGEINGVISVSDSYYDGDTLHTIIKIFKIDDDILYVSKYYAEKYESYRYDCKDTQVLADILLMTLQLEKQDDNIYRIVRKTLKEREQEYLLNSH